MTRMWKMPFVLVLAALFAMAAWTTVFATGINPPENCIDVVAYCSDAPDAQSPIAYWGEVVNCGTGWLKVNVIDVQTGQMLYNMVPLAPGGNLPFSGYYMPGACGPSTNSVEATGYDWGVDADGNPVVLSFSDIASATCSQPCDGGGGEGCTPGFWKNHLDDWAATGFSPGDSFAAIFGQDYGFATLLDAVNAKGDTTNSLVRHAAAGLLNASSPYVDYPMTVAQVIAAFQAGDKASLVAANESFCPY